MAIVLHQQLCAELIRRKMGYIRILENTYPHFNRKNTYVCYILLE